jgi:hypothetical protein
VTSAIAGLWNAIGEGLLTAEEAVAVAAVADRSMQAIELAEQTRRLEEIETLGDQIADENSDKD